MPVSYGLLLVHSYLKQVQFSYPEFCGEGRA